MIVNNTSALSFTETRAAAFPAAAPSLVIIRPDLSFEPAPPAVTATASNAGLTQTLTANYLPAQGGAFGCLWNYTDGTGAIQRIASDFAYWTDVPDLVRQILQMKPTKLTDPTILQEFSLNVTFLLAQFGDPAKYPCLASYNGLSAADAILVDQAVAHMVAVELYGLKFAGTSGLIDQVKVGNFQFNYTENNADQRSEWIVKAARCLGYISCIRAYRKAKAASWSGNTVTGPSRQQNTSGDTQGLINTVLNAYQNKQDQTLL